MSTAPNVPALLMNRLIASGWTPDRLPGPRAFRHADYGEVVHDADGGWRVEPRGGPGREDPEPDLGPFPDLNAAVAACAAVWRRRARAPRAPS